MFLGVLIKKIKKKNMAEKKKYGKGLENYAAIFIPGGLFIGMGIGFIVNHLVGGLFIGLGVGFILYAATVIFKRRRTINFGQFWDRRSDLRC